ncbi:MAG: HAD-IIA family hydrolase, partial [Mycobacteriales bacterium]
MSAGPDSAGGRAALADIYDVALFDLDGVLYAGTAPIEHAAEAVAAARAHGLRPVFVTNNASRTAPEVVDLLGRVGVPAQPAEVATSAQAAAHLLAGRLPAAARVLVCGSDALRGEIRAVGLTPVGTAGEDPIAVVQGYDAGVGWRELAEATVAVRRGAWWVATNADLTLPSPRGPLPGNGALVQVVAVASGRYPVVAGKPEPTMHREAMARAGAGRALVVGDRLDTDILGANRVGCDSLLVRT